MEVALGRWISAGTRATYANRGERVRRRRDDVRRKVPCDFSASILPSAQVERARRILFVLRTSADNAAASVTLIARPIASARSFHGNFIHSTHIWPPRGPWPEKTARIRATSRVATGLKLGVGGFRTLRAMCADLARNGRVIASFRDSFVGYEREVSVFMPIFQWQRG